MAVVLYDLILLVCAVVLIPWYLVRRLLGLKSRAALGERFARYAPGRLAPLAGRPVIWVHAVSVGETRAAIPLLKGLRREWPDHALVVTNVTETGHATAAGIPEIDLALFFPYDLSWVMQRALTELKPQLIVIVETEIWPNLVRVAARNRIPLILANGRISDRSFPRYLRFKKLLAPVLQRIDAFCMQSAVDAERIVRLGAPTAAVSTSGNLKFDMPAGSASSADSATLRDLYRLPQQIPLLVAGSTHEGEEAAIVAAFQSLLAAGRELVLVLVPRHPERSGRVEELLRLAGIASRRRTSLTPETALSASGEVLLVDTLGELLPLYRAADVVFVGGSLVPVGGHNILEAALVGKPVLFGPHMHNFREISELILQVGGGFRVAAAEGLADEVARLLDHPEIARQAGESGLALIDVHRGATERTLAVVRATMR